MLNHPALFSMHVSDAGVMMTLPAVLVDVGYRWQCEVERVAYALVGRAKASEASWRSC